MHFINPKEIEKRIFEMDKQSLTTFIATDCLGKIPTWLLMFLFEIQNIKASSCSERIDFERVQSMVKMQIESPPMLNRRLEKPIVNGLTPSLGFIVLQSLVETLPYVPYYRRAQELVNHYLTPALQSPECVALWAEDLFSFSSEIEDKLPEQTHPFIYQLSKLLQSMAMNSNLQLSLLPLLQLLVEKAKDLSFSRQALFLTLKSLERCNRQMGRDLLEDKLKSKPFSLSIKGKTSLIELLIRKGNALGVYESEGEYDEHLFSTLILMGTITITYPNADADALLSGGFLDVIGPHLARRDISAHVSFKNFFMLFSTQFPDVAAYGFKYDFFLFLLLVLYVKGQHEEMNPKIIQGVFDALPASYFEAPMITAHVRGRQSRRFYLDALLQIIAPMFTFSNVSSSLYPFFFHCLARFNEQQRLERILGQSDLSSKFCMLLTAACFKALQEGLALTDAVKVFLKAMLSKNIWGELTPLLLYKGAAPLCKASCLSHLIQTLSLETLPSESRSFLVQYLMGLLDFRPGIVSSLLSSKVDEKNRAQHPVYQLTQFVLLAESNTPLLFYLGALYDKASEETLSALHLLPLVLSTQNANALMVGHWLREKLCKKNLGIFLSVFHETKPDAKKASLLIPFLPPEVWARAHKGKLLSFKNPTPLLLLVSLLRIKETNRDLLLHDLLQIAIDAPEAWAACTLSGTGNRWSPWSLLLDIMYYDKSLFSEQHFSLLGDFIAPLPKDCWMQSLLYKEQVIEHPLRLLVGLMLEVSKDIDVLPMLKLLYQHVPRHCWHQPGIGDQAEVTAYTLLSVLLNQTQDKPLLAQIHLMLEECDHLKQRSYEGLAQFGFCALPSASSATNPSFSSSPR